MAKFVLSDLRIDGNNCESGIISLLKIIKPSWKSDSITIKPITGGYSGRVFRCHEDSPEDSLTVRIRHASEKIKTWKNDIEFQIVQYLAEKGHFPTIHAIFANGYCYEYIKGRTMINQRERIKGESIDDTMLIAIAKELAYIHKIKLEDVDYSKSMAFTNNKKIFETLEFKNLTDSSPPKDVVLQEIDFVAEYLLSKNPTIVTCHGDPHAGNFVWNNDSKKVTFVDWEGVKPGYQLQDISYFFLATTLLEPISSKRTVEEIVPSDFKRKFFRNYLEEWFRNEEGEGKEVTDEDIEKWIKDCEDFAMAPLIFYILVSLTFPENIQEYSGDKYKFFDCAMKEYLTLKEKLTGRHSFEMSY